MGSCVLPNLSALRLNSFSPTKFTRQRCIAATSTHVLSNYLEYNSEALILHGDRLGKELFLLYKMVQNQNRFLMMALKTL